VNLNAVRTFAPRHKCAQLQRGALGRMTYREIAAITGLSVPQVAHIAPATTSRMPPQRQGSIGGRPSAMVLMYPFPRAYVERVSEARIS
jgi:hypothetical protein